MSKILVTGADGFTGRHLASVLLDEGHEVHGLVRNSLGKRLDERMHIHDGNLEDEERLLSVLQECQPEKIVHLAAISFVGHGDPNQIYMTNLIGARNLLEAVSRKSERVTAVLLSSSANIYGNQEVDLISESTLPSPANDYSVSKVAMEYVASLYKETFPTIVVRPFNYTGLGQSKSFLVPRIVDHVLRRAPRIELGNIDIERDWSDVRFVVRAYARLLETPQAVGQTINICSGVATSLRDLVMAACKIANHQMEIDVNPAFVRANEVRSLRGDNSLLRSLIGDLPAYQIQETLRWMITGD